MRLIPIATLDDVQERRAPVAATGAQPWRVVRGHEHRGAILDAEGRTIAVTSIGLAHQIVTSVNAHANLVEDNAALTYGLSEAKKMLKAAASTPATQSTLQLIDGVLSPGETL